MAPTPLIEKFLHLLTVRGGLIAADTVFCGGRWPASLLAEMEAADA
jgi:hypothetical protein